MRRGPIRKEKTSVFGAKYIIPTVFLLIGVAAAYGLVSRDRTPEPRPEPIIIRPEDIPPLATMSEENSLQTIQGISDGEEFVMAIPIGGAATGGGAEAPQDQFSDGKARVAAYKANSSALKKTVDQYASSRANQCAGEITVRTDDTPLNVRSGPSTGNPVLSKVAKGSKQDVLLWAPDAKTQSGRWFLLVDSQKKTVKGWVSGEYCDTSGVVFAN